MLLTAVVHILVLQVTLVSRATDVRARFAEYSDIFRSVTALPHNVDFAFWYGRRYMLGSSALGVGLVSARAEAVLAELTVPLLQALGVCAASR
jgi:hypothetical protein